MCIIHKRTSTSVHYSEKESIIVHDQYALGDASMQCELLPDGSWSSSDGHAKSLGITRQVPTRLTYPRGISIADIRILDTYSIPMGEIRDISKKNTVFLDYT